MKEQLRHAVIAGIIFGILTVFMFLVGFIGVGADLVAGILGNKNGLPFLGMLPSILNMYIFMALVGLWAGTMGARIPKDQETDPWNAALLGGLTAGVVHGLIAALLAFLVGTMNQNGVQISKYLTSVLPADIRQFLGGNSPIVGAIILFVLLAVMGLLGGVLARGVGR